MSALEERAGVLGAVVTAVMAVEHVLSPETIDLSLAIDPAAFA